MESRKSLHNLVKSINSLLGLKTNLTSTWAESVCNIVKQLPSAEEPSCSSSEIKDCDVCSAISSTQEDLAALYAHLNQLNLKRRQTLNEFLDLKGNIRVFCRIKPTRSGEKYNHQDVAIASDSTNVMLQLHANKSKLYSFDRVFHPDTSQDEIFSEVEPVIKSALDGYNACIFAYGQTGTGKSFTMEGQADSPGVVPRALDALFKQTVDSNHTFLYTFSMLEIYMGNLRDLLTPGMTQTTDPMTQRLSIQEDPKGGIEIDNLVAIRVSDVNQAKKLYKLGSQFRSTASTNCNGTSSRSHCLIRISLSCSNAPERRRETNKIWMVDLGGSERVLKTKARGKRFEEGKAINLSLSALGDLTQILRDCLGDDSKTLLLVHISPKEDDLCETVCSLSFAKRARSIHLGHEESTEIQTNKKVEMAQLQEKVKRIELERHDIRRDIKSLQERLERLTRSFMPSDEKSGGLNACNEDPQTNLEIEKHNERHFTGYFFSKLPRFMRPTICSRKKYGVDLSYKENEMRKGQARRRVRRTSSLLAESITFPVKGISGYGSDYSVSRKSCLARPQTKYSADYETDYTNDASEWRTKSDASLDGERSEKSLARSKFYISRESSGGYQNEMGSKTDSQEHITVDSWFNQQKKKLTKGNYTRQGKRDLSLRYPETKYKSNRTGEHSSTKKRLFNNDTTEKQDKLNIAQRSTTELEIAKTNNLSDNVMTEVYGDESISRDDKVVEETEYVIDDFRVKGERCSPVSLSYVGYAGVGQEEIYALLSRGPDKMDKRQSLLENSEITYAGCNSLCQYNAGNDRKQYFIKETGHHVPKFKEDRQSQGSPTESLKDVVLPNNIVVEEPELEYTLVSDEDMSKEEDKDSDYLYVSSQYLEDLTEPYLQKIGSRKDGPMDLKKEIQEDFPFSFIQREEKIQNEGNTDILRHRVQILRSSVLLGLGIQNLGLSHDFFYGLML
ncbi:hypothetical protein MKX01_016985 [Papaver californicum]|nr:hypothetical protein MKX01_016985 [Papaver californicum]